MLSVPDLSRIGETDHYSLNPQSIDLSLDFAWYFGPSPNLAVAKSANQAAVSAGQEIVYSISVSNVGTLESGPITVEERIPDNTLFITERSDPGWSCADPTGGSICHLSLPALPADATWNPVSFAVRVDPTIPREVEVLDNIVRVEDDEINGPDLNAGNDLAQVAIEVVELTVFVDNFGSGDLSAWSAVQPPTVPALR